MHRFLLLSDLCPKPLWGRYISFFEFGPSKNQSLVGSRWFHHPNRTSHHNHMDKSRRPYPKTSLCWILSFVLVFLGAGFAASFDSNSTCSNGLTGIEDEVNGACCVAACGTCGGEGCGNIPGLSGDDCCSTIITSNGTLCSVSNSAPCIMEYGEIMDTQVHK